MPMPGAHTPDEFKGTLFYSSPKNFPDSLSRNKEVISTLNKLYASGYLAASIDSMVNDSLHQINFIRTGEIYKWTKLDKGNVDEGLLNEIGFRDRFYMNKVFSLKQFNDLQEKILDWCDNNGYPFAGFKLDSLLAEENTIAASLNLQKGNLIIIDSVIIKGTAKLKPVYLLNYISVKQNDVYNESLIKKISSRLRELPMVNELKPFVIEFSETRARIILFLDDKKASQLDGVIGVLPDAANKGKVNLSGDVRLRLQSAFGRGELIDLNWKQPAPKTQDLKLKLNNPFLFSSPIGVDGGLTIYKKDTTYIDVIQNIGLQYLLTGGNYFKIFAQNKKSDLLANSTLQFLQTLPPYADVSSITYGAGLKTEKTDYRLNPRRGYAAELAAGAGTKKIFQNPKIKSELYDNLRLKSDQYSAEYSVDFYFPLFKRTVINIGSKGAYFYSSEIFTNELFRFGGLKTLRGFDEESIYASQFYLGKIEYRYILEQNSFLFAFFNAAYYENNGREEFIHDTPFGFGAGITFQTKLGIFSLNYALGKQFNNPILFRSAKVHFGIVNYF